MNSKSRSKMPKLIRFFYAILGKKKKHRKVISDNFTENKSKGTLQVKLEHPVNTLKEEGFNATSFNVLVPYGIQGGSTCEVKVLREDSPTKAELAEAAYEGGDEHDESLSMKRDLSDFDLQARVAYNGEEAGPSMTRKSNSFNSINELNEKMEREEDDIELTGHVSDPGIGRTAFWDSPKLKRSCSNLESRDVLKKIANHLPASKSHSFEDLQDMMDNARGGNVQGVQSSPLSVNTSCSADRVMLKRRSSSQVLPSRSKRLWWKLFLWSHRNLHKPANSKPKQFSVKNPLNHKGGYTSDTLEPSWALTKKQNKGKGPCNLDSPGSFSRESRNENDSNNNCQNWDNIHGGVSGLWPQNQWVAFCSESSSPFSRVDEWVKSIDTQSVVPLGDCGLVEEEGKGGSGIVYPPSPETGKSPGRIPPSSSRSNLNVSEEVLQANNIIQSLNSFSTVAHIASIGLKVIPNISPFASLRSVNLSGNFIVHINPGSLPKGLHTLNLSKNKITAIEGLRELTRLRVLDLSYNRIPRIGQGLSNCTIIKELYLAGNKISNVEGLHRLLKLTVLDLSFNKITTAKALGQLVANYNSLLALNLLGNPIQSNIGDDQLRKALTSLLPQLSYLNKQPIKPHSAREAVTDSVARAALGNSGWNSRRKLAKRVTQVSTSKTRNSEGVGSRSRHRSRSNHHRSPSARK